MLDAVEIVGRCAQVVLQNRDVENRAPQALLKIYEPNIIVLRTTYYVEVKLNML